MVSRERKIFQLNEDCWEVDSEAYDEMEKDAYKISSETGTLEKDWVKICEWIEMNGEIVECPKENE